MSDQDRLTYIGFTYGLMGNLSFSALLINAMTIKLYGFNKVNALMIIAEICSICRGAIIGSMIPHEYEGWNSIIRNIFTAVQIGIVTYYPVMRCGKILGKRIYKIAKASPYLLTIGMFVREIENDGGLFDSPYPFYGFLLTGLLSYGLDILALVSVSRAIRNNPAGKFDKKQVRIRKISDFMVITAGFIQLGAIVLALTAIRYFSNPLMGLTSFIFATSEFLMIYNKHLPDLNLTVQFSQISYQMQPLIKGSGINLMS